MRTSGAVDELSPQLGLAGLGRFSEPALLILVSLAEGPKHGYLINQDVARFSGHRLGPGTLYGAIARMEERGLIEPVPSTDRRQPYRLTTEGTQVLQGELRSLEKTLVTGQERLRAL